MIEEEDEEFTLTMGKKDSKVFGNEKEEHPECYNKLVLSPDSKIVAIFTGVIIVFSGVSTIFGQYFACFEEPDTDSALYIIDTFMEVCFMIDIVKNFFLKYTDPRDPRRFVQDLGQIIQHYAKGAFFFDFIACIGFLLRHAMKGHLPKDQISLFYLSRLFRLPMFLKLLDPQSFMQFVRSSYRVSLKRKIAADMRGDVGNDSKTDNNKIMHQICLTKSFQVFRIVCVIFLLAYFLGSYWYLLTKHATTDEN